MFMDATVRTGFQKGFLVTMVEDMHYRAASVRAEDSLACLCRSSGAILYSDT